MQILSNLAFAASACALAVRTPNDTCPPVPGENFVFGAPVEMIPGDIPIGCSDYEIIVARGTSEINFADGGKFGVVIGDPIVSNVTELLDGVQGYPVQYPADDNFVQNLETGANDIVARITSQSEMCPEQTFALVGYSQGASIVHKAAAYLPENLQWKVKSISTFGDPSQGGNVGGIWPGDWPYGLQFEVRTVCAEGDPICDVTATCFYNHLIYIRPLYIEPAVKYIIDNFVDAPLQHPPWPTTMTA
ncbi:alpha/beta-hydrolase [Sarocladium strictum]